MNTFLKIIKKLYWLGFFGLAGTFLHLPGLKLFYLFFLLAIIDFVLSFAIVLKTETQQNSEDIDQHWMDLLLSVCL